MRSNDKAVRQIRAILAKSKAGSGATEEEAFAALQFARRLMMRHQLTDADLEQAERTPSQIAADAEYDTAEAYSQGGKMSAWESTLSQAIAALVGTVGAYCETGTQRRTASGALAFDSNGQPIPAATVTFYGPASDVRDAQELYSEWALTLAALARIKFGGAFRGAGRSYAEGFAMTLYLRAKTMDQEQRREISAGTRTAAIMEAGRGEDGDACSALVTVQALALMDAKKARGRGWLEREKGIKLVRSSRGGGRHHGGAYAQGRSDGQSAAFGRTRTARIGQ